MVTIPQKVKHLCQTCQHHEQRQTRGGYVTNEYGYTTWEKVEYGWFCKNNYRYIRKIPTKCKRHLSVHQTKLQGDDKMVKISELATGAERVDLAKLPQKQILMAIREYRKEASSGSSAGLVIVYAQQDGKEFPQKYTETMQPDLANCLRKLKLTSTENLYGVPYEYELKRSGRAVHPRYFPTKKVK